MLLLYPQPINKKQYAKNTHIYKQLIVQPRASITTQEKNIREKPKVNSTNQLFHVKFKVLRHTPP